MVKAIEKPSIVHITGHAICIRPWYCDSNHPYRDLWKKHLQKTPWSECFVYEKMKYSDYGKELGRINRKNKLMKYKIFQIIYGVFSKRMMGLVKFRLKKNFM